MLNWNVLPEGSWIRQKYSSMSSGSMASLNTNVWLSQVKLTLSTGSIPRIRPHVNMYPGSNSRSIIGHSMITVSPTRFTRRTAPDSGGGVTSAPSTHITPHALTRGHTLTSHHHFQSDTGGPNFIGSSTGIIPLQGVVRSEEFIGHLCHLVSLGFSEVLTIATKLIMATGGPHTYQNDALKDEHDERRRDTRRHTHQLHNLI